MRSYSGRGSSANTRPAIAICHGTTQKRRRAAIARATRRAATSGSSRNGIRYGFLAVSGVATYPGQIVTTATPLPCSSTRRLSR
jgi:hypothetical protein